jgi:hypothetical protein
MNYTPVRVDKNTNNVWKWKRNEDGAVMSVPEPMWKPADKWEDHEISSLFDGTAVIVHSEPVIQEPEVIIEQPKKKGGRKKKVEESVVDQPVVQEDVIEQPKEPVYEIKQEEPKLVKKPVTLVKKQPKENYDVYDEI